MTDTEALYWDPFDPALRDDPYPLWARLREEAPLYHNDRHDFYVLSRYADVAAAHKDHGTFSSAHGTTLDSMTDEPMESGPMIFQDPPSHTRLRGLVSRAFTPRRIGELEDRIREICCDLLDPLVGATSFDYVADFGAIVPPTVISDLVGVPAADQAELRANVDRMFHVEGDAGMRNEAAMTAAG